MFPFSFPTQCYTHALPLIRIVEVTGEQRFDNEYTIKNDSEQYFYLEDGSAAPNCTQATPDTGCVKFYEFADLGVDTNIVAGAAGELSTALGKVINITLPAFSTLGTHGFAVLFYNVISSIKFDPVTLVPFPMDIQVLDPLPDGMGEWVTMMAPKWDYQWVSTYTVGI